MSENNKPCSQFPYWGAQYPDACCVDGKLYDLDRCDENGNLYEPIDDVPCPFCRTEEFIELDPFGWVEHFCKEMEEDGETVTNSMEQLAKQKARQAYLDWIDKVKKDEDMNKLVDEIAKEVDKEMKNATFESTESKKIKYMMIVVTALILHFSILYILIRFFEQKLN